MNTPDPDEHGRYRVRRKGDTQSGAWSTTRFDPERHVSVSGPASDTYGNAWPPKPHRRLLIEDEQPQEDPSGFPQPTTNPSEETES